MADKPVDKMGMCNKPQIEVYMKKNDKNTPLIQEIEEALDRLDKEQTKAKQTTGYRSDSGSQMVYKDNNYDMDTVEDDAPRKHSMAEIARDRSRLEELLDLVYYGNLSESEMSLYWNELQTELAKLPSKNDEPDTFNINKGRYFACKAPDLLEEIIGYAMSGDKDNFNKLLKQELDSGDCIYFNEGEKVRLIESDDEFIRLQRVDETEAYWTIVGAISKL
jgi:hypothetical protein